MVSIDGIMLAPGAPTEDPTPGFAFGLMAADLVDAISVFIVPVVLGGGKKLFADGSAQLR